ncbi:MAG: DUF333 domain-containing protein [Comamonas sp.]|uniref:DUF333 domain-containing protein n=1 Tax=Comamonas sp. TaxID=34028 RepID=UPI002FC901FB
MKHALGIAGAVIAAATMVSGCAQSVSINMGSPAAAQCSKFGGKLRIEKTPEVDRSICVLPDGSTFEESVQRHKTSASQ